MWTPVRKRESIGTDNAVLHIGPAGGRALFRIHLVERQVVETVRCTCPTERARIQHPACDRTAERLLAQRSGQHQSLSRLGHILLGNQSTMLGNTEIRMTAPKAMATKGSTPTKMEPCEMSGATRCNR